MGLGLNRGLGLDLSLVWPACGSGLVLEDLERGLRLGALLSGSGDVVVAVVVLLWLW